MTLKEMREMAKTSFSQKHKDDVLENPHTTGNEGTTISHSWKNEKEEETKEDKMLRRQQERLLKQSELIGENSEEKNFDI